MLDAAWVLCRPGRERALSEATLSWSGPRIEAVTAPTSPRPSPSGPRPSPLDVGSVPREQRLIVPALANAHDHARTFRSSTLGGTGLPLEGWLPLLGLLPGVDPYLAAATSFARSVRQGATAVMVHYTRVQGTVDPVEEAMRVARAARDVGVRIGLAVSMRDRHGLAYGPDARVLEHLRPSIRQAVAQRLSAPALPPAVQLERASGIARAIESSPDLSEHVTVQFGPTGVQWCSPELLAAIAQASAEQNRPVHMHLFETRYQRDWADRVFPQGMVRFLDEIGLLSPRLTLAHGTWARADELELLAERGVTLAVNTSSNLHLRSGIAPLGAMLAAGCRVAMGLDGLAFDEDDDALREMRLTGALHRGTGYELALTDASLWAFASETGRRSTLGQARDEAVPGGSLEAGRAADFLVLNMNRLDEDFGLIPGVDPAMALMARGQAGHIGAVVGSGRVLVRDGRVLGVQEDELKRALHEATRSAIAADSGWAIWRDTLRDFTEDLGPFYRKKLFLDCC